MNEKSSFRSGAIQSAKEVARTAVFVALVIGSQYALSALPFVEVVSLLFICYAFVFGVVRGVVAAVAFALLRQLLFGFYPVVLILYLVYFSMLSVVFGLLPRWCKWTGWRLLIIATLLAVVCTACFTLLDDVLTPLYYSYTPRAAEIYFKASIPFLIGQTICVSVSVAGLFLPLTKALFFVKKA
jgi:hypothetical protein